MRIRNALKQFGFTEKQARVYLAALELGFSPVALISKKADIPRATCYDVLESLRKQGIVSRVTKNKTRYYSVEDPKKIAYLAEQKTKTLQEMIPQLEAICYGASKEKPQVRFFQGKEGIKQICEEILEDKQDILAFSSAEELFKALGDWWPSFVQRRVKAGILVRSILRDTARAHERQRLGKQQLRQVKLIPSEFKHQGAILLFGNKIAFFSFIKDFIAVVIESKELAEVERAALEYIWQKAE